MDFHRYLHLEKFGNTAVEGINYGTCHIFPKLDGTNASVWNDEGQLCAGSRNRVLSLENDNANFLHWLLERDGINSEAIANLLTEYPNLKLFGEWLVPHTLKTYLEDSWRQFYVFDVYNQVTERYLDYEAYSALLDEYGVTYIPCQKIMINPSFEDLVFQATLADYCLPPNEKGEGITVKNYDFINKYGRYAAAKVVNTDFKASHRKVMGAPTQENKMNEQTIAESFTKEMAEKVFAKIHNENDEWHSKFIPRLLETCYYDFFNEELWDAVKKSKIKSVDFNTLRHFIQLKTKEYLPQVF